MSKTCIKALVSGRVQGVFFRATTQRQALSLGLKGYAKNLSDGRVEVWLEGDALPIQEMQQWLNIGPPEAIVDSVQFETAQPKDCPGFEVC